MDIKKKTNDSTEKWPSLQKNINYQSISIKKMFNLNHKN